MMKREVFEGVKAVDFGWIGVGSKVMTALALYGATVVRVESIKRPEMLRTAPPYKDGIAGINRSGFFAFYNAGKYDITLDLKHPKGAEIAKRLVSWADVVSNSFAAGAFERLGLGYDDLTKIKPNIIMYRTCSQGLTGPHAKHPGFGSQVVGIAGFTHLTGWPDRDPVQPFGAYTDHIAMPFGIIALAGALDYLRKTGKGQLLDLSQFEASIHFLTPFILDYEINHRDGERMGNACPYGAPHGAYRCHGEDRWCVIAVFTDEEWRAFGKVIGNPTWIKNPKFATLRNRKQNEEELNAFIEQWTKNHTAEEVMNLMQKAGVAAGIVANTADQCQEPLNRWGSYLVLKHKEIGPYQHLIPEFNLSETPANARMPSPCLGEHTEYVCKEFLKMSEAEFDELLVSGVFE